MQNLFEKLFGRSALWVGGVVVLLVLWGLGVGQVEDVPAGEMPVGESAETVSVEADSSATGSVVPNAVRSPVAAEDLGTHKVVRVVDGDTFSVSLDGVNTTIRLIGIDTPEVVDPRTTVQCFGQEASAKAKEILTGASVRLELDAGQGRLDKYGRLLAYAFLPDGANFAELMIREGYGHEYTYDLPYRYLEQFKAAEDYAREAERGLWAPGACEEEKSVAAPAPVAAGSGEYVCSADTYNCSNFSTHSEAQSIYESCGGVSNDIHRLDADKDGEACESLPD